MASQKSVAEENTTTGTGMRPTLYVFLIVLVGVSTYAFKLHTEGIFSCPADGYAEGRYLAYCNATAYGDFDHGAFWYSLAPTAVSAARNAEVLFVGSSRMQFGFSSEATQRWFENRGLSYYLLGFTHEENALFFAPLMEKIQPSAKLLIINVDNFFKERITAPVESIFAGGDSRIRYEAKERWQPVHRRLCQLADFFCARNYVVFRNLANGHWWHFGVNRHTQPGGVEIAVPDDVDNREESLQLAGDFLGNLHLDRSCILLTVVPSMETPLKQAEWLSSQLGLKLVAPFLEDLRTFDSSHLDTASAERWSAEFLKQASATIARCTATDSFARIATP